MRVSKCTLCADDITDPTTLQTTLQCGVTVRIRTADRDHTRRRQCRCAKVGVGVGARVPVSVSVLCVCVCVLVRWGRALSQILGPLQRTENPFVGQKIQRLFEHMRGG